MTTRLLAVPTPFILIPPTTATSFLPDFGLLDLEHDATTPPDNRVRLHAIEDTAPRTTLELISNIGPMAAYSLQALLNNSFELIFGVASVYGADDAPMHFCHLFSKGTRVVDCALMEIKGKNARHQSALDGLTPLSIAVTIEWLALPIQQNVASLHTTLVTLASIMDDTMDWLKKTKLALEILARHNNIILDATQRHLDKGEMPIKQLIKHNVANTAALEKQHGWLVALKLWVKKVKEDGTSMVGLLCKEVDDIKGRQFLKICGDINKVSTAITTLDKNVRDSLDEVHLCVDALLQCTTTSPAADVQATPLSD
jgi:hypothetical protein